MEIILSSREIEQAVSKEMPDMVIAGLSSFTFNRINIGEQSRIVLQVCDGGKRVSIALSDDEAMDFADTFSKMVRGTGV